MKRFLSKLLGATALFVLAIAFTGSMAGHASAAAGVRANVTYQARLMDASGYPVTDGVYQVRFSLYDAAVAGTRLWTAAGTTITPTPVNVSVQDGLFTVLLGDGVTQLPFGDLNWNSDSLYLGVTIGADAEMSPRRPITAVPQAINSSQLNGMSASGTDTYGGEAQFTINQASTTAATSTRSALDVRTNGTSLPNDFILRGLNGVGSAVFTVNSQGSVTSSNLFVSGVVSTTQLFVNGQQVCLQDGTNCLYPSEADTFESVTLRGATTSQALTLFAGATMNVLSVTDTAIIANLNATNLVAIDATTTNLFSTVVSTTQLFVNGLTVCLNDGTNCPASFEIDTLASVTGRGATTSVAVTFFGGVTTSQLNVTSELLSPSGTIAALFWSDASSTNTTGTNAYFTNLRGSSASFTDLLATSSTFGQATATAFFSTILTATNAGIVNATATNLAFTNASGASMVVTVLNGSTVNASTSNIGTATIGAANVTTGTVASLTFANATGGILDVVSVSATSLLVSGQNVCLANGTNCLTVYSTDTLATITARGATTSMPVSFFGGVTSSNINVSGTANLANVNASSVSSTNGIIAALVSGAVSSTNLFSSSVWGTSASFTNLTVSGTLVCLANGTNCQPTTEIDNLLSVTNRGSVATATLNLLGGAIVNNITVTSTLTVSGTVSSNLIPTTDLTFSLGTPSLRWNGNFGTVTTTNLFTTSLVGTTATFTNATATNFFASLVSSSQVLVNGFDVCLSNGTNCAPSAGEADTLATVTARGATSSVAVTFFGGVTTTNLNASSALIDGLSWTNGMGTNTTGTNAFFANLSGTTGSFNELYSVSSTIGQATATAFFTQTFSATNAGIVNATTTNLAFTNASGASMIVTILNSSTVNASTSNIGVATIGTANVTTGTIASLAFTGATGTSLSIGSVSATSLLVSGQQVCLANGTNCVSMYSTDTLAMVTARGATTSVAVTFFGGVTSSNINVSGTANLANVNASSVNVSGGVSAATGSITGLVTTNATATNVTSTNLFATNGVITNGVLTNATATNAFITSLVTGSASSSNFFSSSVWGTSASFTNLMVSGTLVCLADGTNCSYPTEADTLLSVTNRGSSATATLSLLGGAIANNVTVTSSLTVSGTVSSNLLPTTDLTFALGTASLRWNGNFGTVTTTNLIGTNGIFTNATATNFFATTASSTNLFAANGTIGGLIANTGSITSLNGSGLVYGNATFTNATATNLFASLVSSSQVLVNGFDVCLSNGTNCAPSAGEADTLASVTARGATTSVAVTFFGGVTTSNLNASSALIDGISWTNATGTNTTGTNAFFANLRGTTASFNELYSVSSTLGQATATAFFTQTFSATNAGIVNATATNLAFTNASGASMIVTVLNSSTVNASTSNIGTATIGTANVTTGTITALSFTNATGSTLSIADISGVNASFTNLLVSGQNVCLANGTNCVSMYSTDTLAMVTARGATTSVAVTFFGGVTSSNINVSGTANLANVNASSINVSGGLSAATGSIAGLITTNATATNVTSTNLFATNAVLTNGTTTNAFITSLVTGSVSSSNFFSSSVWGTSASFTNLMVSGTLICLADGTNCSYPAEADTLLSVTNRGSIATATLSLLGGFATNNATVTSTLTVSGTVSSNLTPTTDLAFSLGTPSLRWNGNFGTVTTTNLIGTNGVLANVLITNSTTTNATSTNFFATTASSTNLFAANATIGGLIANSGSITSLSGTGLVYGNATITNATATNLFASLVSSSQVLVGGFDVCLSNGTNCPADAGESDTLASVTARGATTSVAVTFFGGVTTSNLNASSALIDGLSWTNATGTNTTGTNAFFANLRGTTGSLSELYSVSSTLGQATATAFFTQTFSATNAGVVNATTTNLAFTNASGASMIVTVLNSSTVNASTSNIGTATIGTANVTTGTITSLAFTNATGATLDIGSVSATSLLVSGQQVCLANGVNCISMYSTDTLAMVTARGATTSVAVSFFGGVTSSNINVSGTANLANVNASSVNVSGGISAATGSIAGLVTTNATATNVTTTNLFATNGFLTNATATNGFITSLITGAVSSTNLFSSSVWGTNASFTNLLVAGQQVCLADGTNCSYPVGTDTLLSVTNRGSVATATLTLLGGAIANNVTVTSTLTVSGTVSSDLIPTTDLSFALGTPSLRWNGNFGTVTTTNLIGTNGVFTNATFTNATATNLFASLVSSSQVLVGGFDVCLSNGTNCAPSAGEADTLASVTARGATTSVAVTFFGGVTTTNLNATSALIDNLVSTNATATNVTTTNLVAVNGSISGLAWTNATGTNTTGTNAFFANLRGTTASFNELYSASTTLGQATATAFFTQTFTATNAGITNATTTNLAFTNASGASMIITVLNAGTATVGALTATTGTIASLTFTNATGSTLDVLSVSATSLLVSGQQVCLADGDNCLSATTSLQMAYDNGQDIVLADGKIDLSPVIGSSDEFAFSALGMTVTPVIGAGYDGLANSGFDLSLLNGDTTGTLFTFTDNRNDPGSSANTSFIWHNSNDNTLRLGNVSTVFEIGTDSFHLTEATYSTQISSFNGRIGLTAANDVDNSSPFSFANYGTSASILSLGNLNGFNTVYIGSDVDPNGVYGASTSSDLLFRGGSTGGSGTQLYVNVDGTNTGWRGLATVDMVCLADGTNCFSTYSTDTLAMVTARGATTSVAVTFFGGVTTTNLNASSATIDGLTSMTGSISGLSWTDATGTNTTGTNAFFASLRGTTGSFNELYSASSTLGQATATAFYTQTLTATDAGIVNATTTNLAFTNASGASMVVTVLNSSTVNASTSNIGAATIGTANVTTGTVTNLSFTNATGATLSIGSVSATSLLVSGQQVCLANGTNCLSMYSTDTLASVTARGATTSVAVTFFGGVTSSNINVSGTANLANINASSVNVSGGISAATGSIAGLVTTNATATNVTTTNLFATNGVLTNATATNGFITSLITGAVSSTNLFTSSIWGTNASFTNLLVAGQQVCLADGTNCTYPAEADTLLSVTNRGSVATATLALLGGFSTNNATVTSTLTVSGTVSSDLIPTTDLTFALGTPSLRWNGNFGTVTTTNLLTTNLVGTSATFTNATATNLFAGLVSSSQILVGGYNVCLSNGTNCPAAAAEADTLASVTARGATTTVAVTFFGGVTSSNINVSGTANLATVNASSVTSDSVVAGVLTATTGTVTSLAWTNATGTNTTGTNAFFANLRGTTTSFNELYSASTTLGQATATAFFTQTFTATNAGITNATTTNLVFTNATGGSLVVSVLNASTATFGSLTATTGTITSLTFVNATGSTLDILSASATNLLVSGQQVCLANGNNCLSATTSLQMAYNNGNTIATTNGAINIIAVSTTLFGADLFSPILSASLASGTTEGFDISMFGGSSNPYLAGTGTSLIYRDNRFANPGVTTATGIGFSSSDANVLMTLFTVAPGGLAQNVTFANNGITLYPGNGNRNVILASKVNFETGTVITSDFIPDGDGTRSIGDLGSRWNGFYDDINANNVTSVNVTANNILADFGNFVGSLTVNGVDVCLEDGTNCLGITPPLMVWTTDIYGAAILTTTTQDVIIGHDSTYTVNGAPFYFETNQDAGTSTLFVGYNTSSNIIIGGTSSSFGFMNADFAGSFNGNDLFVGGNIGSASSVYTNGEFVVGNASMHIGNGYIRKTDGSITFDASSGFIVPMTDLGLSLGSDALRFNGLFGNTTSSNATTTNLFASGVVSTTNLFVNGKQVCLADGTNCFSATTSLQTAYDAGKQIVLNDGRIEILATTGTADEFARDIEPLNLYGVTGTRVLSLGNVSNSNAGFEALSIYVDDGFGTLGTFFTFTDNRTDPWASAHTSYISHIADAFTQNTLSMGNATSNIVITPESVEMYAPGQDLTLGYGAFAVVGNSDEALNAPFQFYDNGSNSPAAFLIANNFGTNRIHIANDVNPNGIYTGGMSDLLFRSGTTAGSGTQLYVNIDGNDQWRGVATVDMLAAAFEEQPMTNVGDFGSLSKDTSKANAVDGRTGIFNGTLFDLTNPHAPVALASVSTTDSVIKGNRLYVLEQDDVTNDFLRVYDIANPSVPQLLGSTDLGSASVVSDGRITVDGSMVYFANVTSVKIFDAKNPSAIVELGSSAVSGTQSNVSIVYSNGYLVYTGEVDYGPLESTSTLEVFDVRNPAAPVSVSHLEYPSGHFLSSDGRQDSLVRIADRRAYVFSRADNVSTPWVRVFDLIDPANPIERAPINTGDVVLYDFAVADTHVFIQTGGDDGSVPVFQDWNVTDRDNPVLSSTIEGTSNRLDTFVIEGGYAFGTSSGDELRIIDLGGLKSRSANIASANMGQLSIGTRLTVRGEAEFNNGITVQGRSVCLSDGTNCAPASASLQSAYNNGKSISLVNGKIELTAATGTLDQIDYFGSLYSPVLGAGHIENTSTGFDLSVYNDGFGTAGTMFTFTDNRTNPFSSVNTSYISHNPNGNTLNFGNVSTSISVDQNNIAFMTQSNSMYLNSANGMTQFVNYTGEDILYLSDDNWSIRQKIGDLDPESNFNGNLGDVYFRANSSASGTQMYLKTVAGGTTGWRGVATVDMVCLSDGTNCPTGLGFNADTTEYLGRRFEMTSDLSFGADILSMESRGNYVFALQTINIDSLWDGIEIAAYDITTSTPQYVGSYLTSDISSYERPTNLVVDESYAYLGSSSTLIVYDISNPTDIEQITYSAVTGTGNAIALEKYGNYLYELTAQGLVTFDVASATNPFIVSDIQDAVEFHAQALRMKVENNHLYVFANSNTFTPFLYVYDLADPRNPVLSHSESLADNGVAILSGAEVQDGYAYIRDGVNLTVLDVHNPATNSVVVGGAVSAADCTSAEYGLVVANKRAYFTCVASGLAIFDISQPNTPAFMGFKDINLETFDQGAKTLSVDGNRIYIGGTGFGDVVDVGGLYADSLLAGTIQTGYGDVLKDMRVGGRMRVGDSLVVGRGGISSDGDIIVNGKKVCLEDGTNCGTGSDAGGDQMTAYNSYQPIAAGRYLDVNVYGDFAFYAMGSSNSVTSYNLIDPANPQYNQGGPSPHIVHSEFVGSRWYALTEDGELYIFQMDGHANPQILNSVDIVNDLGLTITENADFIVQGKYLLIVSDGTIASLNVSDPSNITVVDDATDTPGEFEAMHVAAEDGNIYLTYKSPLYGDPDDIQVTYGSWNEDGTGEIDLENTFDLPGLPTTNDTNISVVDKRLFVQAESAGESVINIYDVSGDFTMLISPSAYDTINPPGDAISYFKAVGNRLYVASHEALDAESGYFTSYVSEPDAPYVLEQTVNNAFTKDVEDFNTQRTFALNGKYAIGSRYDSGSGDMNIMVIDLGGTKTRNLYASNAGFGNAMIDGDLTVGGLANFNNDITVRGVAVCLADGTNCPTSGGGGNTFSADFTAPDTVSSPSFGNDYATAITVNSVQDTNAGMRMFVTDNGGTDMVFSEDLNNVMDDPANDGETDSARISYSNGYIFMGRQDMDSEISSGLYAGQYDVTMSYGDTRLGITEGEIIAQTDNAQTSVMTFRSGFGQSSLSVVEGNPNGIAMGNAGALLLSPGSLAPASQAYLKTTNGGNTGWQGIVTADMIGYEPAERNSGRFAFTEDFPTGYDIQVTGTTAVVSLEYVDGGVQYTWKTFDLSDPENPVVLYEDPGANSVIVSLQIDGSVLYIVRKDFSNTTLESWDITDPSAPVQLNTLGLGVSVYPYNWAATRISGTKLYTATDGTLSIVDISTPSALALDSQLPGFTTHYGNRNDLVVDGNYVYYAGVPTFPDGELVVIDVSNPLAPSVATTLVVPSYGVQPYLKLVGTDLYWLQDSYMAVIDISNPLAPILDSAVTPSGLVGFLSGFTIDGSDVYVSDNDQIAKYDISDLSTPTDSILVTDGVRSQFIIGNYILGLTNTALVTYELTATAPTRHFGSNAAWDGTFVNVSATNIMVGGFAVCLADGTNCPGGTLQDAYNGGRSITTYDGPLSFISPTSGGVNLYPTNDITAVSVFGGSFGNATSAGFDIALYTSTTNSSMPTGTFMMFTTDRNNPFGGSATTVYLQADISAGTIGLGSMTGGSLTVGGINSYLGSGSGGTTTIQGDTVVLGSGQVSIGGIIGGLYPVYDNLSNFGSAGNRWNGFFNSVTATTLVLGAPADPSITTAYASYMGYSSSSVNGGLCIDDMNTLGSCPMFGINGASIIAEGSINANAYDLAERYRVSGPAEPGDVVIFDTTTSTSVQVSGAERYNRYIAGVVSTKPGFVLGWGDGAPVALSGRVPTKVSVTNGEIKVGDALTTSEYPGYAMKATKPGMILGYALEDVSATGTIEVFIDTGYNAMATLGTDGSIAVIKDDIVVKGLESASASTSTSDSFGLTFHGEGWDTTSSIALAYDFTLRTDMLSTTNARFVIENSFGSSTFSVDQEGVVRANAFEVNDSFDLAERYESADTLEPGDLIMISPDADRQILRTNGDQAVAIGVISTKAGFTLGANASGTYPVALAGRVPTKVTTLNGEIKRGDALVASSIPGVAQKATVGGQIIGYALENYAGSDNGLIESFIQPGLWIPKDKLEAIGSASTSTGSGTGAAHQGFAKIVTGGSRVHIAYTSINAFPVPQVTAMGNVSGGWWLENVTDAGFDIVMDTIQPIDIQFAWQVSPSQVGIMQYSSDGTYGQLDPLTGQLVNEPEPEAPPESEAEGPPVEEPPTE